MQSFVVGVDGGGSSVAATAGGSSAVPAAIASEPKAVRYGWIRETADGREDGMGKGLRLLPAAVDAARQDLAVGLDRQADLARGDGAVRPDDRLQS